MATAAIQALADLAKASTPPGPPRPRAPVSGPIEPTVPRPARAAAAVQPPVASERERELKAQLAAVTLESEVRISELTSALAANRSEVEALRQSAVELESQMAATKAGWNSVTEENDRLRLELSAARGDRDDARAMADARGREIASLRARVDAGSNAAFTELALISVGDALADAGLIHGEHGFRLTSDLLVGAPTADRLREYHAVALSYEGRDGDALAVLESLPTLTRHGRPALATSALRLGRLPADLTLLGDLEWSSPTTVALLRPVLARVAPAQAMVLLDLLRPYLAPPVLGEFLDDQYERELPDQDLIRLLETWETVAPSVADARLLEIATRRPVGDAIWLDNALERALGRGTCADACSDILAKRLAHRDPVAALTVVTRVAGVLSGSQSLRFRLGAIEGIAHHDLPPESAKTALGLVVDIQHRREGMDSGSATRVVRLVRRLEKLGGVPGSDGSTPVAGGVVIVPARSALKVLEAVAAKYPDLVVLDSAYDSARQWVRTHHHKLLQVLDSIGGIAERYRLDPGLDPWVALGQVQCKFAGGISQQAFDHYRVDYERRTPDGRAIRLGPHFTVGSKSNLCRVYLAIDEERHQIVVGHVGDKLRDSTHPHR